MADISRKAQQSVIDWLANTATHGQTLTATVQHFESESGFSVENGMVVVVTASQGGELSPDTGIFQMRVDVTLYAHAEDNTESQIETERDAIESALQWNALPAALSAEEAAFKVWGIVEREGDDPQFKDGQWRWSYQLNFWAQAQD